MDQIQGNMMLTRFTHINNIQFTVFYDIMTLLSTEIIREAPQTYIASRQLLSRWRLYYSVHYAIRRSKCLLTTTTTAKP